MLLVYQRETDEITFDQLVAHFQMWHKGGLGHLGIWLDDKAHASIYGDGFVMTLIKMMHWLELEYRNLEVLFYLGGLKTNCLFLHLFIISQFMIIAILLKPNYISSITLTLFTFIFPNSLPMLVHIKIKRSPRNQFSLKNRINS